MQAQLPFMADMHTLPLQQSSPLPMAGANQAIGGVKRTKVSRACDECRRKKTRCDVAPEGCSTCRRANVPCTFARAQLKRGPTKRRNSHTSASSPEVPLSPLSNPTTQKRHQSSPDIVLPGIGTLLPWQPLEPSLGTSRNSVPPQMQGDPLPTSLPPKSYSHLPPQPKPLALGNAEQAKGNHIWKPVRMHLNEAKLRWYYTCCHPIFPILPGNMEELHAYLAFTPCADWLVSVINGTARSAPVDPHTAKTTEGQTMQLMALLLLYLQTLDFTWLGAAVGNILAFNSFNTPSNHANRLYMVVAVLDRIHSAVFNTQPMLAHVPKSYSSCAPEQVKQMARLLGVYMDEDEGQSPPPEPSQDPLNETIYLLSHTKSPNSVRRLKELLPEMESTPIGLYMRHVCDGLK